MAFWHRFKKKILKRYVLHAFFPATRPTALRWCGWDVGEEVYIADGLLIVEELADQHNLSIGNRVSIAPRVTFVTSSHPNNSRIRSVAPVASGPIVVEDDVWIGAGAVVLPGVRIRRGAVVGALALVTQDVDELTVVAGQPARPIRKLEPPPNWT
jgi:galactoside O-acetyltransferase